MHRGLPWTGGLLAMSVVGGSEASPVRRPPPHTPQSPPRTPAPRWSRTPPTCSLHACSDDATLSMLATTALKLRIHLLSY